MQRDEVRQSVEKSLQKLDECLGGGYLTYEVDHWTDFIQTALDEKEETIKRLDGLIHKQIEELVQAQQRLDDVVKEAVIIASGHVKQRRQHYDDMADFADDPKMTDSEICKIEPVYQRAQAFLATDLAKDYLARQEGKL